MTDPSHPHLYLDRSATTAAGNHQATRQDFVLPLDTTDALDRVIIDTRTLAHLNPTARRHLRSATMPAAAHYAARDRSGRVPPTSEVTQAAAIGTVSGVEDDLVDRLATTRTIEITTSGHRSRRPVRIEIWWFHFEKRFIITGTPGPRDWLANLRAEPRMIVHALGLDLPATTRPLTDRAFRRRFFTQPNEEVNWYLSQSQLDELVDTAPVVEVLFAP